MLSRKKTPCLFDPKSCFRSVMSPTMSSSPNWLTTVDSAHQWRVEGSPAATATTANAAKHLYLAERQQRSPLGIYPTPPRLRSNHE